MFDTQQAFVLNVGHVLTGIGRKIIICVLFFTVTNVLLTVAVALCPL
jgi:hypothetical protein